MHNEIWNNLTTLINSFTIGQEIYLHNALCIDGQDTGSSMNVKDNSDDKGDEAKAGDNKGNVS